MKVKQIRQSIELLLNLGDYSNIKLIADVSAEVGETETFEQADEQVRQMVLDSLQEQKSALEEVAKENAELFSRPR